MLKELYRFPENCERAIKETRRVNISGIQDIDTIVLVGMGGSAIGGLLLRDWLLEDSNTPIIVSRGYNIPGFVDPQIGRAHV